MENEFLRVMFYLQKHQQNGEGTVKNKAAAVEDDDPPAYGSLFAMHDPILSHINPMVSEARIYTGN